MASATWTQSRSKNCWDFTEPTVTYVDNGNGTAKVTIKIYARRIDSNSPFYGRTTSVSSNSLTQNSFTPYNLSHDIVTSSEWSKNKAIEHVATLVVTGTPNSSGKISCTIKIYGVAVSYGYGNRDCTMTISALNGITVTSKYTLTYTANGGTGSNVTQSVNAGSSATLKAANTFTPATTATWGITLNKDGGTGGDATFVNNAFYKWLIGSSYYDAGGSYKPTENTTVKAYWSTNYKLGTPTKAQTSANGYTVTFDAKGGSCSTTSLTQQNITTYSFGGWKSDSSGNVWDGGTTLGGPAKYSYTAQWTPTTTKGSIKMPSVTKSSSSNKTVTLNYDGATGGNSTASLSYTKTTAYAFKGWSANSSATSGSAAGSSFTPTASGTVYAIWGSTTNTYTSVTLPTPTKTGYTFSGWATSSGGSVVSTGGAYTPTSDITNLYAIWTVNTYKLTVYPQSGTWEGSTSSQSFDIASTATRSIPVPTRTGYYFGGWMSGAYGTLNNSSFKQSAILSSSHSLSVYDNNNSGTITITWVDNSNGDSPTLYGKDYVTITKTTGTASPDLGGFKRTVTPVAGATYYHTIYAKIPKGYTIQKKSNSIDGTFTWLTDQAGTNSWKVYAYKLVVDSAATKLGAFGYITIKADSGSTTDAVTWYVGANQITKSPTTAQTFTPGTSASYLYASWIPNKYTVKYNANGGTGTTSNSTHYYGYSKTLTANGFTKFGYTFKGWATSLERANAGTVDYADKASVSNLTTTNGGTVNLYAVWEIYTKMYIYTNKKDGTLKWVPVEKYTYTGS